MDLVMNIKNIKSIKDFTFRFPLEKGLYAITGENASGKSAIVACAATVFFRMSMNEYFGRPEEEASIKFTLGETSRSWIYKEKRWASISSDERMPLNGFYEGSVIFGNRFKDTNFNALRILDSLTADNMNDADEFVRTNLGKILHENPEHYATLKVIKDEIAQKQGLHGQPYFYKISQKKFISQARMSTGENLLITILHSLNIVQKRRNMNNVGRSYIVFLDEIELALHASALRRLVDFLQTISDELDLAIFFSTHSLELIRDIKPQNIFYLTRHVNNSISVTNPCYPAYATRNLYSDDGYGNDAVIFVEDDLAKCIIERILLEKELLNNIRLKILPTGGWTNTLVMAHDVISSRLLLKGTKIIIILDKDIKGDVPQFLKVHKQYKYLEPDFLPLNSLEKYLKDKIVDNLDEQLYKKLDNYIFQGRPLTAILRKYTTETDISKDTDGKTLYGFLIGELRSIKKEREDLVEIVVKHLLDTEKAAVDTLGSYLTEKLKPL
jgi:ABC-type phosphonate transport system ATPase subunit